MRTRLTLANTTTSIEWIEGVWRVPTNSKPFGAVFTTTLTGHNNLFSLQAWLRSSGFWWDEDALELGCSIDDGTGRGATRIGVRARRRLEIGECSTRLKEMNLFGHLPEKT